MDRWSWTISIPGLPSMVPAARTFVRAFLGSHPLAGDAELVASEYVTNAIRHSTSGEGGGVIHVTVVATARTVRIEVTDHGRAGPAGDTATTKTAPAPAPAPKQNDPADDDENGRGLLIVDYLAARWGHFGLATGQITAWAELGEAGEPGAESGPGHDPVHDP